MSRVGGGGKASSLPGAMLCPELAAKKGIFAMASRYLEAEQARARSSGDSHPNISPRRSIPKI